MYAQSDKDAYKALKKIEVQTETGVNYSKYSDALVDAKLEIEMFLQSPESKKMTELSKHLERSLLAYEVAKQIWSGKFRKTYGHRYQDRYDIEHEYFMTEEELNQYSSIFPKLSNASGLRAIGPAAPRGDGLTNIYRELAIDLLWKEASLELKLAYDSLIGK